MDEFSISVIVPIYNGEKYLRNCIDSIVGQTYKKLEILLIDDGSTDKSLDICNEYSIKDDRVIVIHKENAGLVAARKTGIENATGTYITFVDADDYIDIDAYENIVEKLDSCEIDLVAYGLQEEYSERTVKKGNHFPSTTYYREKIENLLFPSMLSYGTFFDFGILPNLVCKLIRRKFFYESAVEVSDSVTIGEDADVTFQLLVNAKSVQLIDYAPYHYCKRSDSMMWKRISQDSIDILEFDLRKAFKKNGCLDVLSKQLTEYIAFVTLLKNPRKLIEKEYPFNDINRKVALYGAGGFGQAIYEEFNKQVVLWVDRNYVRYSSAGLDVRCIEQLDVRQEDYDVIYISILNKELCVNIKEYLLSMGIGKEIYYYGGY